MQVIIQITTEQNTIITLLSLKQQIFYVMLKHLRAAPKAHAKLWRIIDYAVQLIAEQIEAGRMADFTLKEAAV